MLLYFLYLIPFSSAQLDLCEPGVDPSIACLCTRLDFMDTYSFRLRFGNSTFAGSNYHVYSPSFKENYDCLSDQPLECSRNSENSAAFAVFNMKYVLELPNRIPSVRCYPSIRMFDMDNALVQQFQATGDLPGEDLHLTEVGCIAYGPSLSFSTPSISTESEGFTSTANIGSTVPEGCTCSLPPPIMTQSLFNYKFAWQFPKVKYEFGTPQFSYAAGCQSVSMVCNYPASKILQNEKQFQKAFMFFDNHIISGNDIRDVASRFNLHCDSGSWRFDAESEEKFNNLLGSQVNLTELGCVTITEKK